MRQPFHIRNRYIFILDIIMIALVTVFSYLLRLEAVAVYLDFIPTIGVMLLVAYLVKPLVYRKFGLYQRFWAYASAREALTITLAVSGRMGCITGAVMFGLYALGLLKFFLPLRDLHRLAAFPDWRWAVCASYRVLIAEGLLSNNNGSGYPAVFDRRRRRCRGIGCARDAEEPPIEDLTRWASWMTTRKNRPTRSTVYR